MTFDLVYLSPCVSVSFASVLYIQQARHALNKQNSAKFILSQLISISTSRSGSAQHHSTSVQRKNSLVPFFIQNTEIIVKICSHFIGEEINSISLK